MTLEPTLLFCVGATKAGTTWLFDYLAGHRDCHLRSIKELHYFDCVETGRFGQQLKLQRAAAERLAARGAPEGSARAARLARKRRDVADWIGVLSARREDRGAYLGYLQGGIGARRLVADITPAYALLPETRLRAMAGLSPGARFVYLLRDPVARLWSHVRMLARRESDATGFEAAAGRIMDSVLDGAPSGAAERGDYAGSLTRLRAAVEPSRLLVMFQEEMTSLPGLARLCGFLGIAPEPGDFGKRVHEGAPLALPEAQRARAAAFLRPQYDYVSRLFPDLPESWTQNMGSART